MKTKYSKLLTLLFVLTAILMSGCSDKVVADGQEPLPEGMGRIRISISTP